MNIKLPKGYLSCFLQPQTLDAVRLRVSRLDDLSEWGKIECDPETKKYMKLPSNTDGTPKSAADWSRRAQEQSPNGVLPEIIIADVDTDQPIGRASIRNTGDCHRSRWIDLKFEVPTHATLAELVIVVAAWASSSKHYGTSVARLLIHTAFEELDCDFVVGITAPNNINAINLMSRLGFWPVAHLSKKGADELQGDWQYGHIVYIVDPQRFGVAEQSLLNR